MKLIVSETSSNNTTSREDEPDPALNMRVVGTSSKRVTFPDEETMTSMNEGDYDDDDQNDPAETSFVSVTTTSSIVDNRLMKRKIAR